MDDSDNDMQEDNRSVIVETNDLQEENRNVIVETMTIESEDRTDERPIGKLSQLFPDISLPTYIISYSYRNILT